jgi:hydrogenase expression/formation protein HypE
MDKTVTLAHGAGGTQTAELIDQVFKAHFSATRISPPTTPPY